MNTQWHRFSKALDFYSKQGFVYLEAPWIASTAAIFLTKPAQALPTLVSSFSDHYLVGSAEQSFVDLMIQSKIAPGKYMAITPCFRDEVDDELHKKYFMKLELINYNNTAANDGLGGCLEPGACWRMVTMAHTFFETLVSPNLIQTVATEIGTDINVNDIEVGSYGHRSFDHNNICHEWIYGTGLAEPRFSSAAKL